MCELASLGAQCVIQAHITHMCSGSAYVTDVMCDIAWNRAAYVHACVCVGWCRCKRDVASCAPAATHLHCPLV